MKLGRVDPRSVVGKILKHGEPYYADDSPHDPWFEPAEFVHREHVRSSAGIPLLIGKERVGIFFVNYRQPHPFTPQEKTAVRLFATQAAIAIQNARLYEGLQKRTNHLNALVDAAKVVTAGVERRPILERILHQAVDPLTGAAGPKADLGTIQLYNASAGELVFECAYPPQEQESLVAALGDRQPIDRARAPGGKIGIIGRAAATREPQLVPDTAGDPDYVEYRPSTRSELAVPLLDGETLLGVLNVESDQLAAFDASDVEVLQGLADLAVVALKNAEQAADLSFATSVAMMSAEGAEMAHDVNREVGHIRRAVYILQRRPELGDEVSETLRRIDSSAEAMAWVAVPSSSAEWHQHREFPDAPLVDQVVAAEITRINVARGDQLVQARLQCGDTRVRVPERRLQRLVRHLIQNAANAIPPEKENPYVIVQTAVEGALVRVRVEDSGTGVSTTHLPSLFKSPIHDSDGRLGYGLLLVRFWAEQYGGGIELVSNRPGEGACFSLTLPAAEIDGATTAIGEG
jgi:GAF domain-containing protein